MDSVNWPAPKGYEYPPSLDNYGAEACVLSFMDGSEALGELLGFSDEEAALRYRPEDGGDPVEVHLRELREIWLRRSVPMQREDQVAASGDYGDDEKQLYTMELVDGAFMAGESVGHVRTPSGIYLFTESGPHMVRRRLVCAGVVQSFDVLESRTAEPPAPTRVMKNARLAEVFRDKPDKYPWKLEQGFARIVQRISEVWLTPQAEHYFNDLMVDRRGGRQGFPADIMSELMSLFAIHTAIVTANAEDPLDPWGFEAMARELEGQGIVVNQQRMTRAIELGDVTVLKKLIMAGLDVNEPGEGGWTPLMVASFNGQEKAALMLIDAGASINARDNSGYAPLHWAAMNGYLQVTHVLLARGAMVNVQNNYGWTPLLHASGRGQIDVVRALLQARADPDLPDQEGWTPLHKAAVNNHAKVVEALLEAGANPDVRHKDGATPLMLANEKGNREIRAILMGQGQVQGRVE